MTWCSLPGYADNVTQPNVTQPNVPPHPSYIPTLAASCAACHGQTGNSLGITPVLAGLNSQHFISEMRALKQGTKPATVMHRHAKGLTEDEITWLAEYFSKQTRRTPPSLQPQPLRKTHE